MQSTTTTVTASDGTALHTHRWLPDGPPKAVVQIAHGLGEHSGPLRPARRGAHRRRLRRLRQRPPRPRRHRAATPTTASSPTSDGWATVVADLRAVTGFAQEENPGLPVFLLGHSMGSYLARGYVIEDSRDLAGLVLSATGGDPGWLGKVGPAPGPDRGAAARAAARQHRSCRA